MKAKQISLPKNSKARPTTDKLRSAIFSIISEKVENAKVLDAFAGSGALGIEAISRGASYSYFIDLNIEAVKLNVLGIDKNLYSIKKGNFLSTNFVSNPYDIIFIDPPYNTINSDKILSIVDDNDLLSNSGIIVYEEFYKTEFINHDKFNVYDERKYGDTIVRFIEKK